MPLPVLTYLVSYQTELVTKPNVRLISFGDGYEERAPLGINNNPRVYNVRFDHRSAEEAADIFNFFNALNGVSLFQWTPPAPFDIVGNFLASEMHQQANEFNDNSITVVFTEKFQPS